ncbi:MAG: hypothetical protein AVDCRST_MAG88-791, partial [uncultured Thermomicrobiales bacterium]
AARTARPGGDPRLPGALDPPPGLRDQHRGPHLRGRPARPAALRGRRAGRQRVRLQRDLLHRRDPRPGAGQGDAGRPLPGALPPPRLAERFRADRPHRDDAGRGRRSRLRALRPGGALRSALARAAVDGAALPRRALGTGAHLLGARPLSQAGESAVESGLALPGAPRRRLLSGRAPARPAALGGACPAARLRHAGAGRGDTRWREHPRPGGATPPAGRLRPGAPHRRCRRLRLARTARAGAGRARPLL